MLFAVLLLTTLAKQVFRFMSWQTIKNCSCARRKLIRPQRRTYGIALQAMGQSLTSGAGSAASAAAVKPERMHVIEYSPTSRATCKRCRKPIGQRSLRVGRKVGTLACAVSKTV